MPDRDDTGDLVASLLQAGSKALSTFQVCNGIIKRVRRKRFTMFLDDIGRFSDEMTDSEHERFIAYIHSDLGQEVLTDLADHAVRTRSHVAIAALAILFANPASEDFDESFRAEAPHRIEGISDHTIFTLLTLCAWQQDSQNQTAPVIFSEGNVQHFPRLKNLSYSADSWLEVIDELLSRRILEADTIPARISGSPAHMNVGLSWHRTVRFTRKTQLYGRLFARARAALNYPPV